MSSHPLFASLTAFFTRLLGLDSVAARDARRWLESPDGPDAPSFMLHEPRRDFLRHPEVLWRAGGYLQERAGLSAHVLRASAGLSFLPCDALVVVPDRDWKRALQEPVHDLLHRATMVLRDYFESWAEAEGLEFEFPERGVEVQLVRDGSSELGFALDLQPGTFATRYGPRVYLGPRACSERRAEIWQVAADGRHAFAGVLWTDQRCLTLGAGALDHVRLEELARPGALLLQQLGGELVARVGAGSELEVVERSSERGRTLDVFGPGRELRVELLVTGSHATDHTGDPVVAQARSPARLRTLEASSSPGAGPAVRTLRHRLDESRYRVRQTGFLIRRAERTGPIERYTLDIDSRSRVVPSSNAPVARLRIDQRSVSLIAVTRGVTLDGHPLQRDRLARLDLRADSTIAWPGGELVFQGIHRGGIAGWGWFGRVAWDGGERELIDGEVYTIGRDPDADIPLPDRGPAANITWRDRMNEGPIRVGEIEVDRALLGTDSMGVGGLAASIDLQASQPGVNNLSTASPLYVIPTSGRPFEVRAGGRLDLPPGSRVLVGNTELCFLPRGGAETEMARGWRRGRRPRVGGLPGMLDVGDSAATRLSIRPTVDPDRVVTQQADLSDLNGELKERLLKIRQARLNVVSQTRSNRPTGG